MAAMRNIAGLALLVFLAWHAPAWPAEIPQGDDSLMARLLRDLTDRNERIHKSAAKLEAARLRVRETWGEWLPGLELNATTGGQRQFKEGTSDNSLQYQEWDIKLTQRLWDFGKTNGKVRKTIEQWEKARAAHEGATLKLLLDGARAILNVAKNIEVLELAKKAENNIHEQAEMEKNLITAGAGLATDLLQANAQYAAAQTRRIRAEGALIKTHNEYIKLFGQPPEEIPPVAGVESALAGNLPEDLDEALRLAVENHPDTRAARFDLSIAREELRQTRAKNYFPSLTIEMDHKWQNNMDGTEGRKNDSKAGIKLNMPFNLGLTAIDAVSAERNEVTAAEQQLNETVHQTEEEVRNAWQDLITLRAIAVTLARQAEISSGFLELARQERKLGTRSLLDILSGETSLINAQSDAAAARVDVVIGMIALLKSTGQLSLELLAETGGTP
ncbi:MAG: TolC family protein [Magnetococcales bacterium]|nr:TolC family protein [Magnetococcales bacterium]